MQLQSFVNRRERGDVARRERKEELLLHKPCSVSCFRIREAAKIRFKFAAMNFEWDKGNSTKSEIKHRITCREAESIWIDANKKIFYSRFVPRADLRYLCIGMSRNNRLLSMIYVYKNENLIRPISTRHANKKEERLYYAQ